MPLQDYLEALHAYAATLANSGVHPRTGRRALPAEHVPPVLAVMATCGMYDHAGSWLYEVGMPARSGVGGGILAVLPGRFGIGVYPPAPQFPLLAALRDGDLDRVRALIETVDHASGECVFEAGTADDDRVFLVISGQLSVLPATASTRWRRRRRG